MTRVTRSGGDGSSDRRSGSEGAGGARSALISGLVAQLKRGEITKTELFSRLQQLQGPTSNAASTSVVSANVIPVSGTAHSVSTATSSASALATNRAENFVAPAEQQQSYIASPPTTFSVQSSARETMVGGTAPAGLFSALDRQVIIQKIADERRRRVEELRRSLPAAREQTSARCNGSSSDLPLPSSSMDLSAPVARAETVELDSSATSQASLQDCQERGVSSPLIPGDPGGACWPLSQGASRTAARRKAWEKGQGEQQEQTEGGTPPPNTFDVSSDEFPFPSLQDRRQRDQGHKDLTVRRDVRDVEDTCIKGLNRRGGDPRSPRRYMTATPASLANSGDAINDSGKNSNNGSTGPSHMGKDSDNERLHVVSRHRGDGSGRRTSGRSDEISSAGSSLQARRPPGSGDCRLRGRDTSAVGIGLDRKGSGNGGPPIPPTEYAAKGRSNIWAESCKNSDRKELSPQERLRSDGAATVRPRQGVRDATRSPADKTTGTGGWVTDSDDVEVNGDDRQAGGRRKQRQPQQKRGWLGGSSSGVDGEGPEQRPEAREKMVDEDAYRFRSFSEERARRGEELVRQELMSECTFRPKIKHLPQSYGATNHDDTPFLQRVNQWQRDKEKYADARKADEQDKELAECTFAPRVNSISRRAARSRRQALGGNHLVVDDRLYDESVRREMERSHLAAEQAEREEERLQEECTFKPDLATKRAAEAAAAAAAAAAGDESNTVEANWGHSVPRGRSRYRQAAAAVAAAVATGGGGSTVWGAGRRANGGNGGGGGGHSNRHWELESCTFTPNIIGARKGMNQAQQYLQHDVVDRLTGAAFRAPDDDDDNDTGSAEGDELCREDGGTLRAHRRHELDFGLAGAGRQPEGAGATWDAGGEGGRKGDFDVWMGDGVQQRGEKSPRRKRAEAAASDTSSSFHAFLSRQNKMETDKRKHIEQMQAMSRNTYRPEICPESNKIYMESNKGDFLQRVARDAARKEHEAVRQKAAGLHDPDCTFKPQITARSATLPPRSVVELSRGDQLKRETTQRLARLRAEQELLADTTFRPRINADASSRMAVSKLKVVSDPDSYIANVETIRRRKAQTVVRGALEKAAKEVEGCTFQPVTTECPAYIKRIAQSISASRALADSGGGGTKRQQAQVKPDWR